MNIKQKKEKVEQLLKEREIINHQLETIGKQLDPTKPWKVVFRTQLDIIV